MKVTRSLLIATTLPVMICTSGCENPQALGATGLGLGIAGQLIGGDLGRVMTIAGGVMMYTATQQQIAQAQATANEALRRASVRNAVRRSNVRYVAVPVKRDKGSQTKSESSNMVMLVDAETGKPTNKAYTPDKEAYKQGEEVKVGGTKAVVATSFAGI